MGQAPPTRAELSPSDVDAVVALAFGRRLAALGFLPVGRRRWVRERTAEIRDVFDIRALRGPSLYPVWGVSLSYVPHIRNEKVRWHRKVEKLVVDVAEVMPTIEAVPAGWLITAVDLPTMRAAAGRVAAATVPRAARFWDGIRGPEDVVTAVAAVRARSGGKWADQYLQLPLAEAFSLAWLGRADDAKLALERSAWASEPDVREPLESALVEAADEGRAAAAARQADEARLAAAKIDEVPTAVRRALPTLPSGGGDITQPGSFDEVRRDVPREPVVEATPTEPLPPSEPDTTATVTVGVDLVEVSQTIGGDLVEVSETVGVDLVEVSETVGHDLVEVSETVGVDLVEVSETVGHDLVEVSETVGVHLVPLPEKAPPE